MVYLLNDFEATLPIFSTICNGCKHWIRKPGRKCLAFPDGIPLAIWLGENDHRAAFPGDHGIQFMPKPVVAATPKPTKVRKKRVVVRRLSTPLSRFRSRLWQDPQVQQQIVEIITPKIEERQAELAALKRLPSVEAVWLDGSAFARVKPRRKKTFILG